MGRAPAGAYRAEGAGAGLRDQLVAQLAVLLAECLRDRVVEPVALIAQRVAHVGTVTRHQRLKRALLLDGLERARGDRRRSVLITQLDPWQRLDGGQLPVDPELGASDPQLRHRAGR